MDYFSEAEKIYSPKTKEYFREVLSSYANGNYRSAIVMLYSVCLCDLLYKLEELRDMYNDAVAKKIISDIETHKINSNSKSSWEKELVDSINSKTKLLDLEACVNMSHLYDYRNLSAHPALNGELDLISPPKEIVAAYIRTSLESILIKPAIFVKDVIAVMSEDLDSKKGYILSDINEFERYVDNKYLCRMNDSIFIKTFQTIWRFTFRTVNDDCNNNRHINRHLLSVMYNKRKGIIITDIGNNSTKYDINDMPGAYAEVFRFLSDCSDVYDRLNAHTKMLITNIHSSDKDYKLVSWFESSKKEHINLLIKKPELIHFSNEYILNYFVNSYKDEGLITECLSYLIVLTKSANSYDQAIHYFGRYIHPYLKDMKMVNFEALLSVLNTNSQFYDNWDFKSLCSQVLEYAKVVFPSDYDWAKYSNITKYSNIIYE